MPAGKWLSAGLVIAGFAFGEIAVTHICTNQVEASTITVSYGDQGSSVKQLQQELLNAGFDPGAIDGIFGSNTLSALNAFQKVEGLPSSKTVGQATWNALQACKFYVYDSTSSNNVIGTYTNYQSAVQSLKTIPGGAVKNQNWAFEYIQPVFYTYANSASNTVIGRFGTLDAAMSSLRTVPGGVVKNSQWQFVYFEPTNLYFTYFSANTNRILNSYTTETAAEDAVSSIPGGVVKNAKWQFVYITPTYYTYASPGSNQILGKYPTLQQATDSLYFVPRGVVKNSQWQFVYVRPSEVYYTYDSTNSNTITGMYSSLSDAETALANIPGGIVKNSSWQYVYIEPVYYTYPDAGSNDVLGKFTTLKAAISSLANVPGGVVKNAKWQYVYQNVDYTSVDLRYSAPSTVTADQINSWLGQHSSSLVGLGAAYVGAQATYGVNATYLLAHSILESGWGSSNIAQTDNNIYGYGAYDSAPGTDAGVFPSESYAIEFEAYEVRNNYLKPGSSHYHDPTLSGMNVDYATGSSWAKDIGSIMNEYVTQTGGSFSGYKVFNTSNTPPAPKSSSEPSYYFNGAKGTVQAVPYYSGIPVYSSMDTGENEMFYGNLSTADESHSLGIVATLQQFLNSEDGAGLTIDGFYGPETASAVSTYQKNHGMTVNGECDYNLWTQVVSGQKVISKGAAVSIDSVKQGMYNGVVTEWYHVTDTGTGTSGWVNSDYINFTNVSRIYSTTGDYLTLDGYLLHNGAYVVVAKNTVQFCDASGKPYAVPTTSQMTLTSIVH